MKLSLVNCDGGQKDDNHRPDAMVTNLPNTTSSKLYQSSFCQKIFCTISPTCSYIISFSCLFYRVGTDFLCK